MEGLFKFGRTEVTDKMLYNSFYKTMNRILKNINNKQNEDKIFEKSSTNKKIFIIIMMILSYCLINIPLVLALGQPELLIIALIFPGI